MGSTGQAEANVCPPARWQVSGGLKDTLGALKEKVGGVFGSERYAHHLHRAHLHSCSTACRFALKPAMLSEHGSSRSGVSTAVLTPHVKQQCRLLIPNDNLIDRVM